MYLIPVEFRRRARAGLSKTEAPCATIGVVLLKIIGPLDTTVTSSAPDVSLTVATGIVLVTDILFSASNVAVTALAERERPVSSRTTFASGN